MRCLHDTSTSFIPVQDKTLRPRLHKPFFIALWASFCNEKVESKTNTWWTNSHVTFSYTESWVSIQCCYWDELSLVWQVPTWDLDRRDSRNRTQSHKRKPVWTSSWFSSLFPQALGSVLGIPWKTRKSGREEWKRGRLLLCVSRGMYGEPDWTGYWFSNFNLKSRTPTKRPQQIRHNGPKWKRSSNRERTCRFKLLERKIYMYLVCLWGR